MLEKPGQLQLLYFLSSFLLLLFILLKSIKTPCQKLEIVTNSLTLTSKLSTLELLRPLTVFAPNNLMEISLLMQELEIFVSFI